jgi:anthranilate synthase component I
MSLTPDLKTFSELAAKHPGKLIPIARTFLADSLTPVAAFRRMPPSPYAFLLESVERGERIGRYSFVGSAPEVILRGDVLPTATCRIEHTSNGKIEQAGDPLAALEKYIRENQAIALPSRTVPPFAGGAVGYLGFDVVRLAESRLNRPPAKKGFEGIPDMLVPIYRTILAFDHVLNSISIVHHTRPADFKSIEAAYETGAAAIENVVKHLRAPAQEPLDELQPPTSTDDASFKSNCERADYIRAVEKAKEYITAGDIIQIVLSQRLSRQTSAHPFEVYRSLRAINPSPYMFYLKLGSQYLVGSSPEVMVRVENSQIVLRPIAGTRVRGKDAAEDARLAADLLADPKERAEHVMLLDLGRNDVGRVAEFGSVIVNEKMIIENYSHVMHIVSNVQGRVREGLDAFDVFRACFPAGTVSGAPKIRAIEIIDELEADSRGPYAGAVGVMDFLGNLNTAIALRTFVMNERVDGKFDAHVQAGAGIVADSVPETEYQETLSKARALLRALSAAEKRTAE